MRQWVRIFSGTDTEALQKDINLWMDSYDGKVRIETINHTEAQNGKITIVIVYHFIP